MKMKWDINQIEEGAGTVVAGIAIGLWRWLSGGAARMDRKADSGGTALKDCCVY